MQEFDLNKELKVEAYLRGRESALGHIVLISIFAFLAKNYVFHFQWYLPLSIVSFLVSLFRLVVSMLYLKKPEVIIIQNLLEWSAVLSGIIWGALFVWAYHDLGLYQAPTLALYIIIAGIAAGAASSLYSIKYIFNAFLFFTVAIPGMYIVYNETILSEKAFGLLLFTFIGFLNSQSNKNRKNLIARIEHAHYLKNETAKIESMFENLPGLFCSFDKNGVIITSNDLWKNLFGSVKNIKNADELDVWLKEEVNNFVLTQKTQKTFEYNHEAKTNRKSFICYLKSLANEKEKILYMVDTTDLKAAQDEIKKKDAHLQHSARLIELGETVGAIAHEINNPLTIVMGKAHGIKRSLTTESLKNEKVFKSLEDIIHSSLRIAKLVAGMKTLVRNSENDPLSLQSFEDHLEIVRFLAQSKSESRGIQFSIECLATDLTCYCRPSQIEQVLINLINNSFDAVEKLEQKWVKLIIKNVGSSIVFEVIDSGHGINSEVVNKIWNPFFTTKEIGKGTGLGLSISLAIAKENNGNIVYRLEDNHTVFSLYLKKAA